MGENGANKNDGREWGKLERWERMVKKGYRKWVCEKGEAMAKEKWCEEMTKCVREWENKKCRRKKKKVQNSQQVFNNTGLNA